MQFNLLSITLALLMPAAVLGGCTEFSSRCNGNEVQYCNGGNWYDSQGCPGGTSCKESNGGAACVCYLGKVVPSDPIFFLTSD